MQYYLENTSNQPQTAVAIGLTVPAKSKSSRPLSFEELKVMNGLETPYEWARLVPVLSESGETAAPSGMTGTPSKEPASERAGRKPRGEKET